MPTAVPWLALGALASGVVSAAFIRYLWPYREEPGARYFIGTIACEALWCLSYGVALLVFDPMLRQALEIPIWSSINFIGVFFLAFALDYTGRSSLIRSKWMGGIVLVQTIHTAVVATNSLHHVAWSNYHIEPILGAATVAYTHQPWLFLNATGVILMIAAASFLLTDTFFSYGPLYRTQAAAVALSPVLPGLAFLLWLLQVGISPPLNLTPLTFPLHLAFDIYAFFSHNMFDMTPAARRVGERTAIDDLGTAVIIVDDEERVIDMNREALRVLNVDPNAALGRPLSISLEGVDPSAEEQTVVITTAGKRREYAVTTSPVTDSSGVRVGDTIVLQDITAERQREQRLAVMNRVLRHNLRNDLNVVQGYLGIVGERIEDEEIRDLLRTAETKTAEVLDLGEKARDIERAMQADETEPEPVIVRDLLAGIEADLATEYPAATIEVNVPGDLRLRANKLLLEGVFKNLVENALEHNDAPEPLVEVALTGTAPDENRATFEIRDNGPGIPEHELAVLEATRETALEHGSGLGLWLVKWGVVSLGGAIQFEPSDHGTTVVLELPDVIRDAREGHAPTNPTTSDE